MHPGVVATAAAVQQMLEAFYALPAGPSVTGFMIEDESDRDAWLAPGARRPPEQLLLLESGDELQVALYLEPARMQELAEHNPLLWLDEENLPAFLLLVEGVSHFRYVIYRAQAERQLSLLELELQAEVDKYLLLRRLLAVQQCGPGLAERLVCVLFAEPHYAAGLDAAEATRYAVAHRYAERYCAALASTAGCADVHRAFWRMPHYEKLRLIAALNPQPMYAR